jgi:flagellar basal body rod protein FlgG
MDTLTTVAASGMRARMEALDMLANNIANASAAGFKADRESYNLYFAEAAGNEAATAPVVEKHWTDFGQGSITQTGSELDLALEGRGFFAVDGPTGPLYTRNGGFRMSKDGAIETQQGYRLRVVDNQGRPTALDPLVPVDIAKDGTVSQNGIAAGRVETADFASRDGLEKAGNLYFRAPASLRSITAAAEIRQRALESASVSPSENAVRLVSVMRQFEMLQRASSIGAEMNRRAVEEVAKTA